MKNLNKKLRFSSILESILIAVFCFSLILSCEKENANRNKSNLTYLDITSNQGSLTNNDYNILVQALKRVTPYVVENEGQLKIQLKSGATLNISDNLFQIIIGCINESNNLLENHKYFLYNKVLIPFDLDLSTTSLFMTKCEGELDEYDKKDSIEYYLWGMIETTEIDDIEEAKDLREGIEATASVQAGIECLISIFGMEPIGYVFAVGELTVGYAAAKKVYEAAEKGPIKIVETTIYGLADPSEEGAGKDVEILDKDGNIVINL
jgi:hypothetical protein